MGVNLTALAVFGGAVGVGLGLGLQSIASNFISGIIILLDKSLTIGDFVELEDGKKGFVREFKMRHAVLETYDGKDILVPNEIFISSLLINWTHKDPKQRYRIDFSVAYSTDVRAMVEIIKDVRELNKNITRVLNLENKYLQKEYDGYRKKLTKVLRVIYLFRTENNANKYELQLEELKQEAKVNIRKSNKSIDKLIRKNLITAEMASSLFNDYTNVNDMIKKLIEVAELLYGETDTLLESIK